MIKIKKRITAEAVRQYGAVSKDTAAIHLNAEAAVKAGYKRPIAHGMYIMGLAQSLYLTDHPAQWITTYSMKFHKPLVVDTDVVFHFEPSDGHIEVKVTLESGDVIASGTFSVKEMK
ncbi:MaoC family dehydratase [Paenibacillus sp. FSL H7-0357]|uniref:MaoC family dehydratase n=1 Tax=unclassified Paenibacillus TaxID=185978 RepID=UPI00068E3158|nr:MaoC family dehydratase [Paenibacillus sp. FSL H7-0357]